MKTLSTSLSIYRYMYCKKKSHSLTFVFKIPVIFLIINNLTSMTLLEKMQQEVSSMYHGSIIILWSYN